VPEGGKGACCDDSVGRMCGRPPPLDDDTMVGNAPTLLFTVTIYTDRPWSDEKL
jgi:hypothetical protein